MYPNTKKKKNSFLDQSHRFVIVLKQKPPSVTRNLGKSKTVVLDCLIKFTIKNFSSKKLQ